MARTRTKQEVRDFLNGLVGQRVNAKSGIYSGQCVSLIKALLEFFDMPNPYAGRGNAISVNDTLLREGLATNGKGWLTIVVNRDMGRIFENGVWNNYGHIWIDLQNEANFEQNGARALLTTKNTRPIQQGQQFVNLDKWIGDYIIMDENDANGVFFAAFHRRPGGGEARQWVGMKAEKVAASIINQPEWLTQNHYIAFFTQRERQLADANKALSDANARLKAALDNDATDKQAIAEAQKKAQEALDNLNTISADYQRLKDSQAKAEETGNAFTRWLGDILNKYWMTK